MKHSRDTIERDYTDNVGHPPETKYPDGDAKKQWDYQGSEEEKQELLERLGLIRDEQQETLF